MQELIDFTTGILLRFRAEEFEWEKFNSIKQKLFSKQELQTVSVKIENKSFIVGVLGYTGVRNYSLVDDYENLKNHFNLNSITNYKRIGKQCPENVVLNGKYWKDPLSERKIYLSFSSMLLTHEIVCDYITEQRTNWFKIKTKNGNFCLCRFRVKSNGFPEVEFDEYDEYDEYDEHEGMYQNQEEY